MTIPSSFTIQRSRWFRGRHRPGGINLYESSLLLLPDRSCGCCMGQVLLQCGKTPNDIVDKAVITDVDMALYSDIPYDLKNYSETMMNPTPLGAFANAAYPVNDDDALTDEQRENKLSELAKRHGFVLTFVD